MMPIEDGDAGVRDGTGDADRGVGLISIVSTEKTRESLTAARVPRRAGCP